MPRYDPGVTAAPGADDLTGLIEVWSSGEAPAEVAEALWRAAYDELKTVAHARLRASGRDRPLDTTALVHESYLRLVRVGRLRIESRGRFFAYSSRVMRSVIVDLARERLSEKRGGGAGAATLNTAIIEGTPTPHGLLEIDAALLELERVEPRLARVVELRWFAGFTEVETAEALEVTERTVRRDWQKARLLLQTMLAS